MPLDTDVKRELHSVRPTNSLDQAVSGVSPRFEPFPQLIDTLVVMGYHLGFCFEFNPNEICV